MVSSFTINISQATEYYQFGGGGGTKECLDSISSSIQNYDFKNTYYLGTSDISIKDWLNNFFKGRCWLYSIGVNVSTVTGVLFPIYYPGSWTIGFYEIYSGTYISRSQFSLATFSKINPPYWILPHWFLSKNEAYLVSLNPPFSTAHTIQWYSYLGRPMIVARDASWIITDVYIQNPLQTKMSQKELAKKYLWDEWYNS